ncbi:sperm acrosome membrane-associated protein 6 [Polymixia lowei]
MWKSVVWVLHVVALLSPSLGCYQCFVDVRDSLQLCWGHVLTEYNIRNVDSCFRKLDRIFNNDERVIEAGRVGEGYDEQLKNILEAEILPMMEEFDRKLNNDTVYEQRLQTAADNFIAAASKLPGVSGCFPPCGFQEAGAVYNCITCQYDSCEFPLDCPIKHIQVMENSRTRMQCDVPFLLPLDIEVVWRYAAEVKTQQMGQFKDVTVGLDRLYSIPSASPHHQGTYQCEIYADRRSLVRLYYHLTVTPQVVAGHTELQEIFDLSLLPGGRMVSGPGGPPLFLSLFLLPPPALLSVCLTALLLLLFLSLWAMYWWSIPEDMSDGEQATGDDDSSEFSVKDRRLGLRESPYLTSGLCVPAGVSSSKTPNPYLFTCTLADTLMLAVGAAVIGSLGYNTGVIDDPQKHENAWRSVKGRVPDPSSLTLKCGDDEQRCT